MPDTSTDKSPEHTAYLDELKELHHLDHGLMLTAALIFQKLGEQKTKLVRQDGTEVAADEDHHRIQLEGARRFLTLAQAAKDLRLRPDKIPEVNPHVAAGPYGTLLRTDRLAKEDASLILAGLLMFSLMEQTDKLLLKDGDIIEVPESLRSKVGVCKERFKVLARLASEAESCKS